MEERTTLTIFGGIIGAVVLGLFVLNAISLS